MNAPTSHQRIEQPDLALLVERLTARMEAGERIDLEAVVKEHPQHAEQIQSLLPAMTALLDLGAPVSRNTDLPASFDSNDVGESRRIGDFRIGREIGRGGMGVVYEAEQISLGRKVALKILPFAAVLDQKCLQRFNNEARAAATLDHPNIVSIFSVGCENAVHFYSMQLIEGQSLAQAIAQLRSARQSGDNELSLGEHPSNSPAVNTSPNGELSTQNAKGARKFSRTVAQLGIQAAEALQHAHEVGIVHRDVKPSNLLLDASGKIWVADFGLAMIQQDADLTRTGEVVGTLRYMSPEMAAGKRASVNHLTDVYSLGATLYELLTLQPAHVAEDRQQLLQQIAFKEPAPLRRIDGNIPAELETIVLKAMSKDMRYRYSSAQGLADDLRSYLEHRPIKAKPPTVVERLAKWTRRNPALTWSALVTLLLVAITSAVAALLVTRQRDVAESRAAELQRRNYLLHLANADHALLQKRYVVAKAELDACPPELRGWEWRYHQDRRLGAIPHAFPGKSEHVTQDGKRLIAVELPAEDPSPDSAQRSYVTTWDIDSGRVIKRLKLNRRLRRLAVSHNERWLAGGDRAGNLFVWNAASGEELWRVDADTGMNSGAKFIPIAFSPHDRWLACTVNGNSLRVFHADSGREKLRSDAFVFVSKTVFSPGGRWLVAFDGTNQSGTKGVVLDVETGAVAAEFPDAGGGGRPAFDPSGQRLATGHANGVIQVWNWDGSRLKEENSWRSTDRPINGIAFSADGDRLVSSDRANAVKVGSASTGELLGELASRSEVYDVAFRPRPDHSSSDDEQIMLGSLVDGVRFWRWRSSEGGKTINALDGAVKVSFSPDGRSILASTPAYFAGGDVYYREYLRYPAEPAVIVNVESGAILRTDRAVYAASWTPDGQEIIATPASGNKTLGDAIRTFDAQSGTATSRRYPGHTGSITISRLSAADGRLISFSNDRTLRVFDFESGEEVLPRRKINDGREGELYNGTVADFSPDASLIGLNNGIWGTESESHVAYDAQKERLPKRFVFSRDAASAFVGWNGGLITQVDAATGEETKRFVGHMGFVLGIAVSPGGSNIVSGDRFGRVLVWEVASQRPLITLSDEGAAVTSLDWSADGRRIAAGREDGAVQIWTLPWSP